MQTLKYIIKRLALMMVVFLIIMTICFTLIRLLEPEVSPGVAGQKELELREARGYNEPIMVQYGIYLKDVFTEWDWGTSWEIDYGQSVGSVIGSRLLPTVLLNVFSLIVSIPIGIGLGVFAALKKNKWQDNLISTVVMVFISVPSYVYAFLLQYWLGFKLGLFPIVLSSLYDAGNSWFSSTMLNSMVLPVMALSFSTIASLTRFTRAELTESLTSEYMLLARTKGLTKGQATMRHALKNAMVPILPTIISLFINIMSGAMIIEKIFAVNGIGQLYLKSIGLLDYDVFIATSMFYTIISLGGTILVDLSYGFLDPRIRMGAK